MFSSISVATCWLRTVTFTNLVLFDWILNRGIGFAAAARLAMTAAAVTPAARFRMLMATATDAFIPESSRSFPRETLTGVRPDWNMITNTPDWLFFGDWRYVRSFFVIESSGLSCRIWRYSTAAYSR